MFIFHKELLWGIFDLDRYVLQKQITGGNDQKVSSVRLDLNSPFEQRETSAILFFSSNPFKITNYTISYQENGCIAEVHGVVTQEESFVVGLLELESGDYLHRGYEGAIFYDQNGQIIEEEGNVQYLK